jgi:hypothetical protein
MSTPTGQGQVVSESASVLGQTLPGVDIGFCRRPPWSLCGTAT